MTTKKIAFINGELIVQQNQNAPKITSIETWTDAFIIYMNIYSSVHTEKFAQLLKYLHTIRLGAKRSAFGWKSYGEQCRLRLSLDPMASWATIDSELWLIYMHGHMDNQPNAMGKVLRCYSFNYNGQCLRPGCQCSHSCMRCFGQHLLRIAFGKMVGSLQTMGKGKLDLVKECRILGCPTWRHGISNLFKIVDEKKTKKHSFNNHVYS